MSERRQRPFLRHLPGASPQQRGGAPGGEGERTTSGAATQLRRSMSLAAERIEAIISTAEEMAEAITREAEVEAERYLTTRRREADLAADERMSGVRRAFDALRAELDALEHRTLAAHASEPRWRDAGGSALDPVASRGASADQRAAAAVRATRLAIAGESRDRIEATLRAEFGLERPQEIVDAILRSG